MTSHTLRNAALRLHEGGKLAIVSTSALDTREDLSLAYTPGVAAVSTAIAENPEMWASHTWASRTVAVVTDGTAVLGLGDIGPKAAMPVMEGKAALFQRFAGLNSIPVCLDTRDVDEIIETVVRLAPSIGGVNLEDISAPRCFEIERALDDALDIPVFHDDQHGTAIVTLAALRNAAIVTDKKLADLRVVISGSGAAGVAIAKMLHAAEVGELIVTDSRGIIVQGRENLTPVKEELAQLTNPGRVRGGIKAALNGADVFIGVSGGSVPEEAVRLMRPGGFIFAMANPTPEVHPDVARKYASVIATGRSDFPNQINNVLAFPGVFRGALDAGITRIGTPHKLAAADALASVVADELREDAILPSVFDERVAPAVAAAVAGV